MTNGAAQKTCFVIMGFGEKTDFQTQRVRRRGRGAARPSGRLEELDRARYLQGDPLPLFRLELWRLSTKHGR